MSHSFYRIHRDFCFYVSFTYQGKLYEFHDVMSFSTSASYQHVFITLHSGDVHSFLLSSDVRFQVGFLTDYTLVLDANDPTYDYVSIIGEYVGESYPDMEAEW